MFLMPLINGKIADCVTAAVSWFTNLTTSTGYIPVIMTFIAISVIYRFLLKPLLGGAASDSVGRAVKKKAGGDK